MTIGGQEKFETITVQTEKQRRHYDTAELSLRAPIERAYRDGVLGRDGGDAGARYKAARILHADFHRAQTRQVGTLAERVDQSGTPVDPVLMRHDAVQGLNRSREAIAAGPRLWGVLRLWIYDERGLRTAAESVGWSYLRAFEECTAALDRLADYYGARLDLAPVYKAAGAGRTNRRNEK